MVSGVLEVEVEFKEDEHVTLGVLEVEKKDEHVVLGCWRSRWSSRRRRRMNMCFWVCWRSR